MSGGCFEQPPTRVEPGRAPAARHQSSGLNLGARQALASGPNPRGAARARGWTPLLTDAAKMTRDSALFVASVVGVFAVILALIGGR